MPRQSLGKTTSWKMCDDPICCHFQWSPYRNTYIYMCAMIRSCLLALVGLQALTAAFLKLLVDKIIYKQKNLVSL